MGLQGDCLREIDVSVARVFEALPENEELAQWMRRYAIDHTRRLARDLWQITQSTPKRSRILEFGSSPFFLTDALVRAGYSVVGLDIAASQYSEIIARCELDIRGIDFETDTVPFENEAFDVALFNEVFEHLRVDLIATMSEVHRVLRPGATLWLSTPNHRSLVGLWTLLWHHRGCHVCPDLFYEYEKLRLYGHMGHVREYTAHEVSDLLGRIGFQTRRIHFRYYRPRRRGSFALVVRDVIERAVTTLLPGFRPMFSLECERAQPSLPGVRRNDRQPT